MADLVTHLCSALLPGLALRRPQVTCLTLGVALPDGVGRLPGEVLSSLRLIGLSLPAGLAVPFDVAHMPVGAACLAVICGTCVVPDQRALATRWLLAGVALHLAFDVLQDHHGQGYRLLFPLSMARWELGWIGSEATVPWAPWLALGTALLWILRWAFGRRVRRRPSTDVTSGPG